MSQVCQGGRFWAPGAVPGAVPDSEPPAV